MMTSQMLLLLLLNFACALGLTLILYRKLLNDKTQKILAFFRLLSFFILGLLLINPELDATTYQLEKPKLVVAVDNSESVKKLSTTEAINNFVSEVKTDNLLNQKYALEILSFGENLQPFTDSLSFEKSGTDISSVIDYANGLEDSKSTFVLLSDGNQTLGEDFNFKDFKTDLSPKVLVLGDTTRYKDSKIDLINVNSYAYFKNEFPVEIFVSQNSQKISQQRLKVSENGKTLASKIIEIPAESSVRTEFIIPASSVGQKVLDVDLEPLIEEKNKINNSKRVALEVIDTRSKILLVSDFLHPDIGFFNRVLASSKELEFEYKTPIDVDKLSDDDLVIFYQPQSSFRSLLLQAKTNTFNFLIVGGSHTDYEFLNSLDLGFQKEGIDAVEEYSAKMNADFSLFLINDLSIEDYPPLRDQFGEVSLDKDYAILLKKQLNGVDVESPLWVFKTQNNRKQSVLFGENIWRWRAKHYMENESFEAFDKTFQKILQFLAQSRFKNSLMVDIQPLINSGDNEVLKAKYYNENFENDTRFDFELQLKNERINTVQTTTLVKSEEAYYFDLSNLEPGIYAYTIKNKDIQVSKAGSFEVLEYSGELQFENANYQSLKSLVSEDDIALFSEREKLISTLKEKNPKPIQKTIKKTQTLLNFEWLILLLALTLSSEWFYRKYKGLI